MRRPFVLLPGDQVFGLLASGAGIQCQRCQRRQQQGGPSYLLNPDTILTLGEEGRLMDLSGLDSAKNLREIIRTANTVDGKLEIQSRGAYSRCSGPRRC